MAKMENKKEKIEWYGEISEYQDGTYEEIACAEKKGKNLTIAATIEPNGLVGMVIASIVQSDSEDEEATHLEYYYRRKILGFGKKELERKIDILTYVQSIEMERFVKLAV